MAAETPRAPRKSAARAPETRDPAFERLHVYLKESRAFDFTGTSGPA